MTWLRLFVIMTKAGKSETLYFMNSGALKAVLVSEKQVPNYFHYKRYTSFQLPLGTRKITGQILVQ